MTGAAVKQVRITLGLTQTELSSRLGVTRSTVWRYENGNLEVPTIYRLALAALVAGIDPVAATE